MRIGNMSDGIEVSVRFKGGTYVTNTVQGKRSSCTSSDIGAVRRLMDRLDLEGNIEPLDGSDEQPNGAISRWRIVPTSID